jgi:hypothetical protein
MPLPLDLRGKVPFLDDAANVYDRGREFMQHPWQSIKGMILPNPQQMQHQQAIDQMNKEANDETVRQANQSFLPHRMPVTRGPVGGANR